MKILLRYFSWLLPLLLGCLTAQAQLTANFTFTPATACPPAVIHFTSTSTGTTSATTYSWTFGNSGTAFSDTASTTYLNSGTYTVTLTVTTGTQTSTHSATVNITPAPAVSFTANDTAICPGMPISFTGIVTPNATGPSIFNLNYGNGAFGNTQNSTYTYNTPGIYSITYSVINSLGCTTSVYRPNYILVHAPPAASFTPTSDSLCHINTSSTTFTNNTTGTQPITYNWDFGDGLGSTAVSPSHAYSTPGSFTVTLIATDANGCKDTVVQPAAIFVRNFTAGFIDTPAITCQGDVITFTDTTATANHAAWNYGDGISDTGLVTTHAYTLTGQYVVHLTTTNASGCMDTISRTINVFPPAIDSFIDFPTEPCPAPSTIQFTNYTTNAVSYVWSFGDGTPASTAVNPSHTYQADGFYDVTLQATTAIGCVETLHRIAEVKIYPLILGITPARQEGCVPLADTFAPVVYYPYAVTSYTWDFGDGYTGTGQLPPHTYTTAGDYIVTLTVTTDNGCSKSTSTTIHVGSHPVFNFTPSSRDTICVRTNITFVATATTPVTSWEFFFNGAGGNYAPIVMHEFDYPGTYTVALVANNDGCRDTLTRTNLITVNYPKSQFIYTVNCDTLGKVVFQNQSLGYTSCLWNFGDGSPSTTAVSPAHTYPGTGFYTCRLITYNNVTGCTDTISPLISIIVLHVDFSAPDTALCRPSDVTFTPNVTGGQAIKWYWKIGNLPYNDTTEVYTYHTFTDTGHYAIALTVLDANHCPTNITKNPYITIAHPYPKLSGPHDACGPGNVTFTDLSTDVSGAYMVTRKWAFGDNTTNTVTTPNVTHFYNSAGTYNISLKVTDNIGCTDSLTDTAYLTIHHPTANFSAASTNACIGVPVSFFNNSNGTGLNSYWSFGDGTTSTASTIAHAYQQSGVYTVKLVITDNYGCKDSMTKTAYINVSPNPHAEFSMDDTFSICPPLIVNFTNHSTGAATYAWNFGNNATSVLMNPGNTYSVPGNYTISLVATNAVGCKDTAFGHARVLGYAGSFTYSPLSGCVPLTVHFTASNVSQVPAFVFDFGDGTTAGTTSPSATHVYTRPGPYVPKLIMTDNLGCSASSTGLDTIKADGIYTGFTYTPFPACDHGTLNFIDTSRGAYTALATRWWKFDDGTTSTSATPTHTYNSVGTYSIILAASTVAGCKDTLHTSVTFYARPIVDAGPDTTICLTDSTVLRPSGAATYTWSPVASLSCASCTNPHASPPGKTVYTVVGKDAHGCTNTDSVTINIRIKTIAGVGPDTEVCAGSRVRLNATGGTTYTWLPPQTLDNSHSAFPFASPATTTRYTVIVKLAGCVPDTAYVNVTVHPKPVVNAGPDQTIIAGNIAHLAATGSTFITGYEWSPVESLSCAACDNPDATPKHTTNYTVVARTDYNCTDTDGVTVIVICEDNQIFVPNTFTPNGNGVNDVFYPRGKGISKITAFRIYDRWGEKVFERGAGDPNDKSQGWDGTFRGKLLPPDVYVYTVEAVCDTGDPIKWQGDVMLLR